MKGNAKVIAALNEALQEELLAINQYFLHAEMCENWKYEALSKFIKKESIEEMRHAEKLLERILFLDGSPTMTGPKALKIGKNVKEALQSDLDLELNAVKMYNRFVKLAEDAGDNASADLFRDVLKDEEGHVDWLEAQMHLMDEVGYERYLSMQMRDE